MGKRKLSHRDKVERGKAKLDYILNSFKQGTSVGASRLSRQDQRTLNKSMDTLASGTRRASGITGGMSNSVRNRSNQFKQDAIRKINEGAVNLALGGGKIRKKSKPRSRKRVR